MRNKLLKLIALACVGICCVFGAGCKPGRDMNKLCATSASFGYTCAKSGMTKEQMLAELEDAIGPLK